MYIRFRDLCFDCLDNLTLPKRVNLKEKKIASVPDSGEAFLSFRNVERAISESIPIHLTSDFRVKHP